MTRRAPYGNKSVDHMAFALSLPVRRWALLYAARNGQVHARDLLREFPEYGQRMAAAEVFHVLRDKGFLVAGEKVLDVAGKRDQLPYTLTPLARQALRDLHALVGELVLEVGDE